MRVTRQGEVTIPKEIMDAAGIEPGAEVTWEVGADGVARLVPLRERATDPARFAETMAWLESIRGTATGGLTTDEIMALTRGE